MSRMEARAAAARIQERHRGGHAPVAGQPIVNRFNPLRDAVCRELGVPYGSVRVEGLPDRVRSHEIHLYDGDASGFIPAALAREDRQEQAILRAESDFEGGAWGAARRAEFAAWRREQRRRRDAAEIEDVISREIAAR